MIVQTHISAGKTILLAAGGTGGHVTPALALADELITRGHRVVLATDKRGLRFVTPREGMSIRIIQSGTLRKNPLRLIRDVIALTFGFFQSLDLLREERPAVVVGFGGYPCFPPVMAAQIIGTPTLLHQSDAVLGKANALLARFCDKLALSLPEFSGLPESLRARVVVTGRPVPATIDALYSVPYTPASPDSPFHIVILGGSQGAGILSHALPEILATLPESLRARLKLTHQILPEDLDHVRTLYAKTGITADIAPFFKDIPDRLKTAHLFIGRSGGTVHEISIAGIPALYIPYPHHKDQQQLKNAAVVARAGGAFILEEKNFSTESVLAPIRQLMQNPVLSEQMAEKAKSCGHPQAARKLADAVLELALA